MVGADPTLLAGLPAHAELLDALRRAVEADEEWRWLELSCSLAAGRGDALSDIDAGVGHDIDVDRGVDELSQRGRALVEAIGNPLDVLVHAEDSWPVGITRLAVEYDIGIQLDLVLMPAAHRPGLPDGALALVDKDGRIQEPWIPEVAKTTDEQAREWAMQGWWSLSDVAKYVRRRSLFEAVASLATARSHALRLFAAGRGVPYPSFGLTSLLDFEPFEVPDRLAETYAAPRLPAEVLAAAWRLAALLEEAGDSAGRALDVDLTTPWQQASERRLRSAAADLADRR